MFDPTSLSKNLYEQTASVVYPEAAARLDFRSVKSLADSCRYARGLLFDTIGEKLTEDVFRKVIRPEYQKIEHFVSFEAVPAPFRNSYPVAERVLRNDGEKYIQLTKATLRFNTSLMKTAIASVAIVKHWKNVNRLLQKMNADSHPQHPLKIFLENTRGGG